MNTIDFETDAIEAYPNYPPKPVGVSVELEGQKPIYLAWGHPTNNNSTYEMAKELLTDIWSQDNLFHNCRFDMAVAERWFDLPWGEPSRIQDTLFMLYLIDPLATSLSLKPSAQRLLNMPPDEQDRLRDWILAHVPGATPKNWGAYISKAPGDLAGEYARGDVIRTRLLFNHLIRKVHGWGMWEAYEREQALAPILNENERVGLRLDAELLEEHTRVYVETQEILDQHIRRVLDAPSINIDSAAELADALESSGFASNFALTPTGKRSVSKESLFNAINDPMVYDLLAYRSALHTLVGTFMRPWCALIAGGHNIHPNWNQVRGDTGGTRTGRLSSYQPNFQNIPKELTAEIPEGYPPLPLLRRYVLADEGQVFVSADFHSQEVRMLGHFAEGAIADIYRGNPSADVHQVAAELINDYTGLSVDRKATKIIAFSILYGAGIKRLAKTLGCEMDEARRLKDAYLRVLTGVREFQEQVTERARAGLAVRTWGGRYLHAPPPVVQDNGAVWEKDYVLVNYLIQGSSADQTKQAIVDYDYTREHGRFLATVHDEICISVSRKHLKTEVALLRKAMEAGQFDLPMRATVSVGKNWQDMESYDE